MHDKNSLMSASSLWHFLRTGAVTLILFWEPRRCPKDRLKAASLVFCHLQRCTIPSPGRGKGDHTEDHPEMRSLCMGWVPNRQAIHCYLPVTHQKQLCAPPSVCSPCMFSVQITSGWCGNTNGDSSVISCQFNKKKKKKSFQDVWN